ncbi:hypothetical protein M0R45_011354 [Rubus argutus]|uniref:Uncharacterized protein n=1 Tax=Rubus argutus TaxID=59490 RepID=A0AAW1Y9S4_RUBAR
MPTHADPKLRHNRFFLWTPRAAQNHREPLSQTTTISGVPRLLRSLGLPKFHSHDHHPPLPSSTPLKPSIHLYQVSKRRAPLHHLAPPFTASGPPRTISDHASALSTTLF